MMNKPMNHVKQIAVLWGIALAMLMGSVQSVQAADEIITYYHTNLHGSPMMASTETGEVLWTQTYSPYGYRDSSSVQAGATTLNRIGFTGHAEDKYGDRQLVYMQARYYNPEIGRFLSADPVGFQEDNPMSFNRYAYGNNNPYRYTDPNGESVIDVLTELAPAAGRSFGGLAAWGVGHLTGNDSLVNAAVEGMASQQRTNLMAAAALATIPGAGKLYRAFKSRKAAADVDVPKSGPKSPHIDPKDVANKTPDQIDQLAKDKGLLPKGPDPKSGRGSYVDPTTGNQRVLCHTNCSNPHGHVNNSQGQRLDIDGNVVAPESPAAHLPINYP